MNNEKLTKAVEEILDPDIIGDESFLCVLEKITVRMNTLLVKERPETDAAQEAREAIEAVEDAKRCFPESKGHAAKLALWASHCAAAAQCRVSGDFRTQERQGFWGRELLQQIFDCCMCFHV